MRCAIYQKEKKSRLSTAQSATLNNVIAEYFAKQTSEMQVRKYIMEQSFSEEEFNEKWKHYKETGELPEKRF